MKQVHSGVAPDTAQAHHWCVAGDMEDNDDTPPTDDVAQCTLDFIRYLVVQGRHDSL